MISSAPNGRPWLLAAIVVAHAAAFALIVIDRPAARVARASVPTLLTFDVPATPEPAPAKVVPAPVEPLPMPPPVVEIALPPPPVISATPVSLDVDRPLSSSGAGCDLTDVVQSALRESAAAKAAIATLPAKARSVANAVMLWDGRWIDGGDATTRRALARIREVVLATVDGATADCRAQAQAGPRLILIPGTPDAVLALGSGRWRWGDLDGARSEAGPLRTTPRIASEGGASKPTYTRPPASSGGL